MTSFGRGTIAAALSAALACAPGRAAAKQLPDLIVAESRLQATGDCGGLKPVVAGDVLIKNIGKARAQIFTVRDMVRTKARGIPGLEDNDKFVNSMRRGEVQRVTVRLGIGRRFKVTGVVTIDIDVDPLGIFKEASETNNRLTVRVTLDCK